MVWKNTPMHLGPLWVLLMDAFAGSTDSLPTALIQFKLFLAATLAATAALGWRLMRIRGIPPPERVTCLFLLLWNPLILQTTLVDGHGDIFIAFALLLSLFFLETRWPAAAGIVLIVGAAIKYVPLILLPVTLIAAAQNGWRSVARWLAGVGIVGTVVAGGSYFMFGATPFESPGLAFIMLGGQLTNYAAIGTVIVMHLLPSGSIQMFGSLAALVTAIAATGRSGSYMRGYVTPFLVSFFFTTPALQMWYLVWILPIAPFIFPAGMVAVGSALAHLIPEAVSVFEVSYIVTFIALLAASTQIPHIARWVRLRTSKTVR